MSEPVTSMFIGVLIAAFLAIKYWRAVLGLLAAFLIAVLIVGLNEMINMVDGQAVTAPVELPLDENK